jgi:hypothetical protein
LTSDQHLFADQASRWRGGMHWTPGHLFAESLSLSSPYHSSIKSMGKSMETMNQRNSIHTFIYIFSVSYYPIISFETSNIF